MPRRNSLRTKRQQRKTTNVAAILDAEYGEGFTAWAGGWVQGYTDAKQAPHQHTIARAGFTNYCQVCGDITTTNGSN